MHILASDTITLSVMNRLSQEGNKVSAINISMNRKFDIVSIENDVNDLEEKFIFSESYINSEETHLNYRLLKSQYIFLEQVKIKLDGYAKKTEKLVADIKQKQNEIIRFFNDSSYLITPSDTALGRLYQIEFDTIYKKWESADSLSKVMTYKLGLLQSRISAFSIKWYGLTENIKFRLDNFYYTVYENREKPLLEASKSDYSKNIFEIGALSATTGSKIMLYYLNAHWTAIIITTLFCWAFVAWILFIRFEFKKNLFRYIRGNDIRLKYLRSNPLFGTLVLAFTFSEFFFPHPPVIFIELIWSLLGGIITIIFFKDPRITKMTKFLWLFFFLIFRLVALINLYLYSSFEERWLILVINIILITIGIMSYLTNKNQAIFPRNRTFMLILISVIFNVAAITTNFVGFFNLTKIFTSTATFVLFTGVLLRVFLDVAREALTFQLAHLSRLYNEKYRKTFYGFYEVLSNALFLFTLFAWVLFLLHSLNVYDAVKEVVINFLNKPIVVGSTEFSIGAIFTFILTIWLASIISNIISLITELSATRNVKYIKWANIRLILKICIITGGVILAFATTGIPIDKIAIVLGALSVGIGLGFQNIVSNIVSGIMITLEQPIKLGDVIETDGHTGTVRNIGIRSTHIYTTSGADILIPNSFLLSKDLTNWTLSDKHKRIELKLVVSNKNDLLSVKKIIERVLQEDQSIFKKSETSVLVNAIENGGFEFICNFWCISVADAGKLKSEVLEKIYSAFNQEKVITDTINLWPPNIKL